MSENKKKKKNEETDNEHIKETVSTEEAKEPDTSAETTEESKTVKEKEPDPKDVLIEKLENQLLRTAAEYDNYRKRTAKERMEMEPEITAKVVSEFLPVLDNLERALQAETTDQNYKKGIELIHESFMDTLKKLGVEEIPTEGVPFDPSCHQAVQQVASE
jgi:molecular chaperone GrpE